MAILVRNDAAKFFSMCVIVVSGGAGCSLEDPEHHLSCRAYGGIGPESKSWTGAGKQKAVSF